MRIRHIMPIAGIILIIGVSLYCIDTIRYSRVKQPAAAPFTIRTDGDSIYVAGAEFFSKTLALPFEYDAPTFDSHNDYEEASRQARLKSPRRVRINFTEPVNSYSVQVVLHPDDDNTSVGMAEWRFTKGGNTVLINTGFFWDWQSDIKDLVKSQVKYHGETFTLAPSPQMVQGRDSTIVDAPFCFKDVDFDSEYELCFRSPGWNRYYFNAYKLLTATSAELMTGHPYHNIVYSDEETCFTVFDYDNQTISMSEVYGSGICDHLYGRRDVVADVLNPMRHISGTEFNYSGDTCNEDYFEDGKWVKAIIIYKLDEPTYGIECEYHSSGDRHFTLKSVCYYTWVDDDKRTVLYKRKD